MSEENGFHGYRDYEDWYDNGPGSESWLRKRRAEQVKLDVAKFNRHREQEEELDRLKKENEELKTKLNKKNDS